MAEFLVRLKQRKLVQWALAYVAAAFALLQGTDLVAAKFGWPDSVERILIIASCIGLFVTLLLARTTATKVASAPAARSCC